MESEPELEALSEVAASLGRTAAIAFRVNPDVDAKTHAKISTGKAENKFGVPFEDAPRLYAKAARLPGIAIAGIHMHIGSQITDLQPFRNAFTLMRELATTLARGTATPSSISTSAAASACPIAPATTCRPRRRNTPQVVRETLGESGPARSMLEPGRMIVANAGVLVSRVIYAKRGRDKTFTIVDAAMNDLIRPTLYEALPRDLAGRRGARGRKEPMLQDVAGPICETGDYLALDRKLPPFAAGDLLAFMTAGAYGSAMSSTYNSRLLVPEVLVKGDAFAVVRPRQTYADLIGLDPACRIGLPEFDAGADCNQRR